MSRWATNRELAGRTRRVPGERPLPRHDILGPDKKYWRAACEAQWLRDESPSTDPHKCIPLCLSLRKDSSRNVILRHPPTNTASSHPRSIR